MAVFSRTVLYFKKKQRNDISDYGIAERFGLIDEETLVMGAALDPARDNVGVLFAKGKENDSQAWACSQRRRGSVPWTAPLFRDAGGLFQMYAARAHLCTEIGRGPFSW